MIKLGSPSGAHDANGNSNKLTNFTIAPFVPLLDAFKDIFDSINLASPDLGVQDLDMHGFLEDVPEMAALTALTVHSITDAIESSINSSIGLPLETQDILPGSGGCNCGPSIGIGCPFNGLNGDVVVPGISLSSMGIMNLTGLFDVIEFIAGVDLEGSMTIPTVVLPDFSGNSEPGSLDETNNFIAFHDVNNQLLGSIRATSEQGWRDNNIAKNEVLFGLAVTFFGIDPSEALLEGACQLSDLTDSWNSQGVEYASGNGDYAEWLEREDISEKITPGDIVAVNSGKITKDLTLFEQIMVVSHYPIMLGNKPAPEREHLGNKIAFMGQVPVKVMGVVSSGDFIVADQEISGYAKAISSSDMTADDFKFCVGRSWEENKMSGPKLVNTVIGVHNGEWVNIVNEIKNKQSDIEQRVANLELLLSN